jgi:rod shape-determining protein MreC
MIRNSKRLYGFRIGSSGVLKKLGKWGLSGKLIACVAILGVLHVPVCRESLQSFRDFFIGGVVWLGKTMEGISRIVLNAKYVILPNTAAVVSDLQKENLKLMDELERLRQLKTENNSLRQLLSLPEKNNEDKLIMAKVIKFFSNDYMCSFILDSGESAGVSVDDVVINENGLIGRIIEAHADWSKVLLIIDTNSSVPVKIGARRIDAIASGDNSKTLKLSMIRDDDLPENGDLVETSGYGNGFRDKIHLGKIDGQGENLRIVPSVNFNFVEYVGVLTKKQEEKTS